MNANPFFTNPFLTTDVEAARDEARVLYLDTLARMQSGGGHSVQWLEHLAQQSQQRLDLSWDAALKLATVDDIEGASAQLAWIVKEWSLYRAAVDLIAAAAHGKYLDPADPDTYGDIQHALGHQVAYLTTELLNEWHRGREQRKAEAIRAQHDWQSVAFQQVQQTMSHQKDWQSEAVGMFKEMRADWQIVQDTNLRYADKALEGVKQAQQGVQHMYDFAVATQGNVVGMHVAFQQHLEQRLPEEIREAAREESRRRRNARLLVVLIILGASVSFLWLSYFLITHLY